MTNLSFTINGSLRRVEADETTPLLYILRDRLQLNGPRYGCGAEQCGACRVMVNGEPVWSCTLPAGDADGADIVTVDGLGADGELHPLQRAFLECNAAQCGYCASGILISALALLEKNDNPSRDEIQQALRHNLCRCGAHNRIIRAVARAAEMMRNGE